MRRIVTAVTIANSPIIQLPQLGISHFVYSEDPKPFSNIEKTRERLQYMAERRNTAHRLALESFPETDTFFSIDTYYLNQADLLVDFLGSNKGDMSGSEELVGGSTWFRFPGVLHDYWKFWDTWTTPEAAALRIGSRGTINVGAVGGVAIYSRSLWERHGFGVPEPFPQGGTEFNYLCRGSTTRMSLDHKFIHPTPDHLLRRSRAKRLRIEVGKWRRKLITR
ncbi:MAG TPA: hypothetical protein VNA15_07415 [Candidatus Angelobacter sp.]|nr:hypothetical protein [Candidatus Angelobacter sp.]